MEIDNTTQQPQDPSSDENASEDEFASLLEESFDYAPPRRGEIRSATIMQIDRNEIIVDMGAKQDGIVMAQDLEHLDDDIRESLEVGQTVPVYVLQPRDKDGNLVVSINMGLQQFDWEEAAQLMKSEEVVDVKVFGYNKGGVLVRWKRLEGFIPSSHMITVGAGLQGNDRRDAMDDLEDTMLGVKIIEVDPSRRRLIFSEREAQREWRAQQKERLLDELGEGDVVKGVVTGLRDFGAFVNLGGADGLIHVSELAWHRIDHPRDILSVGDEIDVYVLNLDYEKNRIALSRKRLLNDPWDDAIERYHEGQLVEGTVTNVVDFGAFIALDDGLEGLLHLSEMGDGTLKEPHSYVKKSDRLQLRISRLEPERRRVGFTQRWGTEQPVLEDDEEFDEAEESESVQAAADTEEVEDTVDADVEDAAEDDDEAVDEAIDDEDLDDEAVEEDFDEEEEAADEAVEVEDLDDEEADDE
jgi:small subunit ribosomal protein S1